MNSASPRLIDHIGILVPDLEAAIERWSQVLGYTFGPIARYRTNRWVDHSDQMPHFHDARVSFSAEGPPRIELMEFTGAGTHSEAEGEGFHHFGFPGFPDVVGRMHELAGMGIGDDGRSLNDRGAPMLWFTDPGDFNGVRLEYISAAPGPIFTDDGRPVDFDENGRPIFEKSAGR